MEGHSPDRSERLLVLGAGPAQLGLLAAARQRGLYVIAVDRDAAAPGFRYADRRAVLSAEDEPGVERLAAAEHVAGLIAPGIDWPVAIAARRPWSTWTAVTTHPASVARASKASESAPPETAQLSALPGGGKAQRLSRSASIGLTST